MTRVVHCKREPYDVYIGRPSKWGNPFAIGRDGTREDVIRKYEEWITNHPELMAAIHELAGQTLGCWCAPQACHGDVLARLCQEYIDHQDHQHRQAFDDNDPLRHYGPEYEEDYGLYERGNPEADE